MKVAVLLFLVSIAFGDIIIDPLCPNGNLEFNPPPFKDDMHEIYPDNSNNGAPTLFPNNYQCNIRVNVPTGMWAKLNINLSVTNLNIIYPVIVSDFLGKPEGYVKYSNCQMLDYQSVYAPPGLNLLASGYSACNPTENCNQNSENWNLHL
ncbi:hypothetical protein B9Z55_021047 [Caenorhabditis nigoni]|uniref:CUB-like domain-containing protein n=1 Tax=Caenorhabditis nigoni TaxID=1611254 RepID=A0A2G5TQH6_9PELO|nr:hypothetical protein B9Z55_021047 [Caenorhabditis nigoni]